VDEDLDAILVAQPVTARDGVVRVLVVRVVLGDHAGCAALGGDGMAAHRVDLGDHRDAELGVDFGNGDRGAQSGTAAADQKNIVRRRFHGCFRPRPAPPYDKRRYFSIRYSYKPHFNPGESGAIARDRNRGWRLARRFRREPKRRVKTASETSQNGRTIAQPLFTCQRKERAFAPVMSRANAGRFRAGVAPFTTSIQLR